MAKYVFSAFLLIALSFSNIDALDFGGKCSTLEYLRATRACVSELYRTLVVTAMDSVTDNTAPNITLQQIYSKTCKNGLLQKTIDCHLQIHKMCDFSVISSDFLQSLGDLLCKNFYKTLHLQQCFNPDFNQVTKCLRDFKFDPNNPTCSVREAAKNCMKPLFAKCFMGNSLEDMADKLIMGRCDKLTNKMAANEKCSFTTYTMSTLICWNPVIFKFRDLRKQMAGLDMKDSLDLALGAPEVRQAMECQSIVDRKCRMSIVNMRKMTAVLSLMRNNTAGLTSLETCFDTTKAMESAPCVAAAVKNSKSVCRLMEDIRQCYIPMFTNCTDGIKATIRAVLNLVRPEYCQKSSGMKKGQEACSLLSYYSGLSLCWSPVTMGFQLQGYKLTIPGAMYPFVFDSCNTTVIEKAYRCHRELDNKCGSSMIAASKGKKIAKATCENLQGMPDLYTCIQATYPSIVQAPCPKTSLLKEPVKCKKTLCRLMKNYNDCSKSIWTAPSCTAEVKNILFAIFDMPATCPSSA